MAFPPPTAKQAHIIWMAVTGAAVALLLALLAGLVWGLGRVLSVLSPVLWPLAVAGVIAYLLDPLVDLIERRGAPRARAILCVFALALMILVALLGSVVPQLVVETRQLVLRIPAYTTRVQHTVENLINHPPELVRKYLRGSSDALMGTNLPTADVGLDALTNFATPGNGPDGLSTNAVGLSVPGGTVSTNMVSGAELGEDAAAFWGQLLDPSLVQSATGWLAKVVPKVGSWLFGQVGKVASWFGVLAGLALIPVYAFYFLLEKRGIESKWTEYLPVVRSEFKDELVFVIRSINDYLIAFFRGQVLVAICDGIMYMVGFIAIGLPYAVLLGVMATVLTLIPYLGAIVTCVAALVLALVQFGDWLHPLLVLGVFAIVQTIEGLVISPHIMGDRVGLHPLTIIIAVIAGTTLLGGLLGGILAIPLTAALRVLMFRYVWKAPGPGKG